MPSFSQSTRIGIMGTGKIARYHAVAARNLGCSIVAGSAQSTQSESWKEFKELIPDAQFSTPQELIDDPNINALIVSMPWDVTEKWIAQLFISPKPMLIEKPLALRIDTLTEAVNQSAAVLDNKLVGFNRRYYQTVDRIAKRVSQGGLKEVSVTMSEDIDKHLRNHGPEIIPHLLVYSSSAHMLDLLLYLLGPLEIIRMYASCNTKRHLTVTSYNGLLEMRQDNVPVLFMLNMGDPSPVGMRFRFDDETTWVLSPLETLTVYDRYEIVGPTDKIPIRQYTPHAREIIEEPRENKPGFNAQMQAFVQGDFKQGAKIQDSIELLTFIERLKACDSSLTTYSQPLQDMQS